MAGARVAGSATATFLARAGARVALVERDLHHLLMSDFSTGRPYNAIDRLMLHSAVKDERCARHFAAYGGRTISVPAFLAPRGLVR